VAFLHYYSSVDFENTRITLDPSPETRPDESITPSVIEFKIKSVLQQHLQRYHRSPLPLSGVPPFQDSQMNVVDPLVPWVNLTSDFSREDVLLIRSRLANELFKIFNCLGKLNSFPGDPPPFDEFISECFSNTKVLSDQHKAIVATPPEYCSANELRKNPYSLPMFKECLHSKTLAQQYDFFRSHKVKKTGIES
jgi:hypothetical protein